MSFRTMKLPSIAPGGRIRPTGSLSLAVSALWIGRDARNRKSAEFDAALARRPRLAARVGLCSAFANREAPSRRR
jgi:hypothetical protein